jgi:hypothetical protein
MEKQKLTLKNKFPPKTRENQEDDKKRYNPDPDKEKKEGDYRKDLEERRRKEEREDNPDYRKFREEDSLNYKGFKEGTNKEYKDRLSELFNYYPIKSKNVINAIPEEIYKKLAEEPMNRKVVVFERYSEANGYRFFDVASFIDKRSNLEQLIKQNFGVAPVFDMDNINYINKKGLKLHDKFPEINKIVLTANRTKPRILKFIERDGEWKSLFIPDSYIILH